MTDELSSVLWPLERLAGAQLAWGRLLAPHCFSALPQFPLHSTLYRSHLLSGPRCAPGSGYMFPNMTELG